MSKKILVPTKPQSSKPPTSATDWVGRPESPALPVDESNAELQVRLTFDIPESLHRRIIIAHAQRGIKRMAPELRRILEQHYPPTS